MLAAVVAWFACLNRGVDDGQVRVPVRADCSRRFRCVLSMTLRFVPKLQPRKRNGSSRRRSKCVGRDASEGSVLQSARKTVFRSSPSSSHGALENAHSARRTPCAAAATACRGGRRIRSTASTDRDTGRARLAPGLRRLYRRGLDRRAGCTGATIPDEAAGALTSRYTASLSAGVSRALPDAGHSDTAGRTGNGNI
jgi:hypothetical protein